MQKEGIAGSTGLAANSSKMMRKLKPGGPDVPMRSPSMRDPSIAGSEESIAAPAPQFSEAELMRALARRPERVGSKLLKEKYSLPTKTK